MMTRQVLRVRVPKGSERTQQSHALAIRQQEIVREFTDFAAHFVRHYVMWESQDPARSNRKRTLPSLLAGEITNDLAVA
jgi:hypothetical protein